MRCDAMRCDAMRCDAMRCDAMRCDAMRAEVGRDATFPYLMFPSENASGISRTFALISLLSFVFFGSFFFWHLFGSCFFHSVSSSEYLPENEIKVGLTDPMFSASPCLFSEFRLSAVFFCPE